MQDQPIAPSGASFPDPIGDLPAADVTVLLELMAQLLGDEQVNARAETYRTWTNDPGRARQMALAYQAERVESMLCGALSEKAGGFHRDGLSWAVERCRQLLAELEIVGTEAGEQ